MERITQSDQTRITVCHVVDDQKSTQGKCVPTSALEDTCWQHSYSYKENTRNHSADFLQGLPCRVYWVSPVLCRESCSYPPKKNKLSAPTVRSKAAGRSLAQHPAPDTPSPGVPTLRGATGAALHSWAPHFTGWKHGGKEAAEHLSQHGFHAVHFQALCPLGFTCFLPDFSTQYFRLKFQK